MSTGPIVAETWAEKIGVFIDEFLYRNFGNYDFGKQRLVETKCEFCQKKITIWKTLFDKQKGEGICCSERCAKIAIR